jgi:hypothetical protein
MGGPEELMSCYLRSARSSQIVDVRRTERRGLSWEAIRRG